jgi:ParB family chromosome partitioning protein
LENVQRKDLNPVEIAISYNKIMKDYGLTQEDVAKRLGVSRSEVANHLRLLSLPESVQNQIAKGEISLGHAKILASEKDQDKVLKMAKETVERKISVKELSNLAAASKKTGLNLEVKKEEKEIVIKYGNDEELKKILNLLGEKYE